jgi:NADPH:quinone reductase-like Zn-dependent oxidoreductase
MQAIRVHHFSGPEAMVLDELPTPEPGPGQVLVRVLAAGVNFVDVYQRSGASALPLPLALGRAGVVENVGPGESPEKGSLYLHRPKLADFTATRQELTARSDKLLGWVQSGKVRVNIAATFPLAEAAATHRLIVSRKAAGKILLIP